MNKILGVHFTDKETNQFIMLRSLEWEILPIYGTRSFAPVFLIWLTWWQLIPCILILGLFWRSLGRHFVNLNIAAALSYINSLVASLVINLIIALYFILQGQILNAVLAICWHLISIVISYFVPSKGSGDIAEKFWSKIEL